jgi:hypothetical protein
MATETAPAGTRPVLMVREKRKFNWLVLALLLAIIAVGLAWQLL